MAAYGSRHTGHSIPVNRIMDLVYVLFLAAVLLYFLLPEEPEDDDGYAADDEDGADDIDIDDRFTYCQ